MKKGFTLMELLVVIVIVGVVSVSSIISFGNIKDNTAITERKNMYLEIQRAAQLYLDFSSSALSQLIENEYTSVSVGTLSESNFVSSDLYDPVTNENMANYFVGLYVDSLDGNKILNSFIYEPIFDEDGNNTGIECISDSDGMKNGDMKSEKEKIELTKEEKTVNGYTFKYCKSNIK